MTGELKRRVKIYGAGVILYLLAIAVTTQAILPDALRFVWFFAAYLLIGFDAFQKLQEAFLKKKFLTEYTLIILATIGAFGVGRYAEGVLVMLLFELGMMFEAYTTDNARRSIESMINIRPESATRKVRGREFKVDPSLLKPGHTIVIRPGERIPADAVVTSGTTSIDTKALTGESVPRAAWPGDQIYGGCINLSGEIEAKVTALYVDSTVSRIMEMVEDAQNKKAESESFVSRFSRAYVPAMLICALAVMIYPSLTFSYGNWETWIYRGLIFLIIACPTGLVMSVPIAFLGGIASAARHGVVVKGGNYLETLAKADTFIFDKTGTLTEGVFKVKEIKAVGMTEQELLRIAAHVEYHSNHPIAQSLKEAYQGEIRENKVYRMREMPGYGVNAMFEGKRVYIGNRRLMERQNISCEEVTGTGTPVFVAVADHYAGYILIADSVKEDAKETLQYLREKCRAVLVMLTGDTTSSGKEVAKELQMDYAYTNLMPEDKLEQLQDFMSLQDGSEKLVCVGDGINDAPVLARADVGIAMGALGSAAAVEAADVILMDDELSRIVDAIKIAKETLRVVSQNITFAMVVKVLILILAAVGWFGMWEAILAEVGVMFVVILNAVWVVKYQV
ncbi:heavy metal translocating P-type ATPase [uncultured Merdimonas sp.]|uniref:heavy metal translocating P-type ATPase n=1 Tax=uncultured Merdimonas sp. TaxID=2023269 RepID=UPI00320918B0